VVKRFAHLLELPARRAMDPQRRRLGRAAAACCCALLTCRVHAHGTRAGELTIDHPYATPTAPGATVGAVYFRSITNLGRQADKLVEARTVVASQVRVLRLGGDGSAANDTGAALELPAGATLKLRHDGPTSLQLVSLTQPLRAGDRFTLTLRFERAGEHEVSVWVQTPRAPSGAKP
jgi:copper(I)-binding protein